MYAITLTAGQLLVIGFVLGLIFGFFLMVAIGILVGKDNKNGKN